MATSDNLNSPAPTGSPASPDAPEVEPVALQRLASARVVDVREPAELAGPLGRIPGAQSVPLATLERKAAGWRRDQAIVLTCGTGGGRSLAGAARLVAMGFSNVSVLRGGVKAYGDAGLPVERGP